MVETGNDGKAGIFLPGYHGLYKLRTNVPVFSARVMNLSDMAAERVTFRRVD